MKNLPEQSIVAIIRANLRLSGLRRIDQALTEVKANLANSNRDRIAKIVLAGQARELQAARWLVDQLWGEKTEPVIDSANNDPQIYEEVASFELEISDREIKPLAVQASLWDKTVKKLQSSLLNSSKTPLEIDVLKDEKKRQLLYIALRQVEQSITDLRFSQISPSQLSLKIPDILKGIWQETIINFFMR
jgi:hypothetical protein